MDAHRELREFLGPQAGRKVGRPRRRGEQWLATVSTSDPRLVADLAAWDRDALLAYREKVAWRNRNVRKILLGKTDEELEFDDAVKTLAQTVTEDTTNAVAAVEIPGEELVSVAVEALRAAGYTVDDLTDADQESPFTPVRGFAGLLATSSDYRLLVEVRRTPTDSFAALPEQARAFLTLAHSHFCRAVYAFTRVTKQGPVVRFATAVDITACVTVLRERVDSEYTRPDLRLDQFTVEADQLHHRLPGA